MKKGARRGGETKSGPSVPWRWVGPAAALFAVAGGWGVREWRQTAAYRAALPPLPAVEARLDALDARLRNTAAEAFRSPRDSAALADLGRLYHANGYTREALACWTLLRSLEPREPRWAYYAADAYRSLNEYGSMVEAWSTTVGLAPDYAPAPLAWAEYLLKTGATGEAELNYQRRLALVPGDPYAQLGLARCAFQNGQVRDAHALLEKLVRASPGFPSAHNLFAEVLAAEGDQARAEEQRRAGRAAGRFKEAEDPWLLELRAWCLDSRRLVAWGTVDFQNNQNDRARELFERAAKLEPANLRNLEVLADMYLRLGDVEKAVTVYADYVRRSGAQLAPPMLYVNYSEALRGAGRPQEALALIEGVLGRADPVPEIVNARGVALTDLGRLEEARAAFEQALRIDDLDTTANYNLGGLLLNEGRLDEGVEKLKKALVRNRGDISTLVLLGQVLLDQGRIEEAGEYFRRLYEAQPLLPAAREGMALWHYRRGSEAERANQPGEAEKAYRAGLAVLPESVELKRALGVLLLLANRPEEAAPFLEQVHAKSATDASSKLLLSQVYLRLNRFQEAVSLLQEGERLALQRGQAQTAAHCREILNTLGVP